MPMSIEAMQVFEELRVSAEKEANRTIQGQTTPAPASKVFALFQDFETRVRLLEEEHDKKGIMVPEPSKDLVAFVTTAILEEGSHGRAPTMDVCAEMAIKALMGRVLHEVKKFKNTYAGEVRAAINRKDTGWREQATGGHEALEKLERELLILLTGRS